MFESFGEAEIEAGVVDEDDVIGLLLKGEREELIEKAFEFPVILEDLDDADDGVGGEVEGEFGADGSELGPARAKKLEFLPARFDAECFHQFGAEGVAAGLAGDDHERLRGHQSGGRFAELV